MRLEPRGGPWTGWLGIRSGRALPFVAVAIVLLSLVMASGDGLPVAFARDLDDARDRAEGFRSELADAVQRRETVSLEEARAARLALDQTVALLDLRREEFGTLRNEQAALQVRLEAQLDAADQAVAGL